MADVYGLIGFPVKHSFSAVMHNAAFKELGIDARYELFEVKPERLAEKYKAEILPNVCGLNVTTPYKERIIVLLDSLDEQAELIGAVNTVKITDKTTKGFNTDGLGFITHLTQVIGINPQGRKVSILGAGGAAKSVSLQLAQHKAGEILLFDIDANKAKGLRDKLKAAFPGCRVTLTEDADGLLKAEPDLLINATSVGMKKSDNLVFDRELLHRKLLVYDLIYNPIQTPLLKEAKTKGCAGVFNGLGMLLYQGVLSFKIWLDIEPPVKVMEQALLERIHKSRLS